MLRPDLDASTPAELIAVAARVNNALKRLGEGWAIFVEAARSAAPGYPENRFPDPVSWLVDEERRHAFQEEGAHFESAYFLTFCYLAPPERAERASRLLYDHGDGRNDGAAGPSEPGGIDWRGILDAFAAETDRLLDLLAALLPDCDLTPGVAPMLGRCHLRTLTLRGLPDRTWPGLLDELNRLPIEYRWVARWL
ncbi:MAG: conjugal transfer protein TrbE, partial [Steroidobacteraceae bacterium]